MQEQYALIGYYKIYMVNKTKLISITPLQFENRLSNAKTCYTTLTHVFPREKRCNATRKHVIQRKKRVIERDYMLLNPKTCYQRENALFNTKICYPKRN